MPTPPVDSEAFTLTPSRTTRLQPQLLTSSDWRRGASWRGYRAPRDVRRYRLEWDNPSEAERLELQRLYNATRTVGYLTWQPPDSASSERFQFDAPPEMTEVEKNLHPMSCQLRLLLSTDA